MIKSILINLVCFMYNWYWIYNIRAKNYVIIQRIKHIDAMKRRL